MEEVVLILWIIGFVVLCCLGYYNGVRIWKHSGSRLVDASDRSSALILAGTVLCLLHVVYGFFLPEFPSGMEFLLPTVAAVVGLLALWPISKSTWRRALETPLDGPTLESDAPIDQPEQATAALQDLIRRLSRLLRNTDIAAPLTIALIGKWGSGKSSVMRMVHRDVSAAGFPCVWLNAWHHQREAHLFAALMETIRCEIEQWSSGPYLEFRLKLVVMRILQEKARFAIFLGAVLILVTGGYWVLSALSADQYGKSLSGMFSFLAAYPVVKGYGFFGRVFGSSVSREGPGLTRFADQLGFRYRFGTALGQVCRALEKKGSLVIVVDDLDRCKPEQVVTILEAVDFLTSNGKCLVLLGIEEGRVKQAIRRYAREVGVIAAGQDGVDEKAKEAEEAYAEIYLEKLINLRIPIPAVTVEDLRSVRS